MVRAQKQIRPGYKLTEVGIIPEEWKVEKLGNIGKGLIGLTYSPSNVVDHGILVLRSSNIQDEKLAFYDNVFVNTEIPQEIFVKENDILICVRNGSRDLIGKSAILTQKCSGMTFGAFMTVYRSEYGKYIYQLFRSPIIKRQINQHLGATINQITNGSLHSFVVALPPTKPEQSAIAQVLSDTDNLIASLDALIEKKRSIKQGATNKLLAPKENWKITQLGEICEIRKGQLITNETRVNGGIPVIAGGKTPAYYHNKANRYGKTITISGSGASAGFVSFHQIPIFASDCSTIEESSLYSIEFLYFFLSHFQDYIYLKQTGGAQPHIHPSDIKPMIIALPTFKEQQDIAQILSDMDAEIQSLEAKQDKYKTIKQGMMSELLTGNIRLLGA